MHNDVILVIVVGTALAFDYTNGFHDTANVVATSISTRAMPPRLAVAYASVLNFARRLPVDCGRRDDRPGRGRQRCDQPDRRLRGTDRRHLLEPDHLVLRAPQGFSAQGAGAGKRLSAVRWGVAGNIVTAWLLTLPAAAAIGLTVRRGSSGPGRWVRWWWPQLRWRWSRPASRTGFGKVRRWRRPEVG
jgi:hypothetical protein